MIRSMRAISYVVGLALACSTFIPAQAQGKKAAEFIPGTVASIEKEKTGKNYKMKITKSDDGEELDVTITIRTPVFVSAKGDEGFLKPGVTIETKAMKSQNNLFSDDFTVYIGALTPPAKVTPDKEKPTELFDIIGKVIETSVDGGIVVQMVGSPPQKIGFEKGKAIVNVKISDASLIKEGDEVTVEGTLVKSKKTVNATMVNVTQKDPIKSEEYLAALEERKGKPKTTAKVKATGKAKAAEGEEPAAAGKGADPFGVLPGKKKAAGKDEPKKDDAKKDEAKKEDAKKDDAKKDDAKKADEKKE